LEGNNDDTRPPQQATGGRRQGPAVRIIGGALDKTELMLDLFTASEDGSCGNDCGCEDCKSGRCPSARLRLNARTTASAADPPSTFTQDLARELRTHLTSHADIVAHAAREEHHNVEQEADINDPAVAAMLHSQIQRTLGTSTDRADALLARNHAFALKQERRALAGQRLNVMLGLTPQRFAAAEVEADENDPAVLAMTGGERLRTQIRRSDDRAR
jgi:hypothetical protein